jgi:RNA polymerase sigma-70 factor (ECF subfamily)
VDDEAELVERAGRGDRSAFESLVRRHQDDLYRFSHRLTWPDKAAAQDLAQDTLLIAFVRIATFRGSSSFRTWLFGIASNLFRATARKARVRRAGLALLAASDGNSRGADDTAAEDQNYELMQRAFSALAIGQKEALYLIDILGCTYEDTATILGVSASAAKNRVHHARLNMILAVRKMTGAKACGKTGNE